jgi:hypothetical protein
VRERDSEREREREGEEFHRSHVQSDFNCTPLQSDYLRCMLRVVVAVRVYEAGKKLKR